jgi:hypothetical protein
MRGTGLAIPAVAALVAIAAAALGAILALELVATVFASLALALETLAAIFPLALTTFMARRALAAFARLSEIAVAVAAAAMLAGFFAFGRLSGGVAGCGLCAVGFALVAMAAALVTRAALVVTAAGTPDFDQRRLGGGFRDSGSSFRS